MRTRRQYEVEAENGRALVHAEGDPLGRRIVVAIWPPNIISKVEFSPEQAEDLIRALRTALDDLPEGT